MAVYNHALVDRELLRLWLDGHTVGQAAQVLYQRELAAAAAFTSQQQQQSSTNNDQQKGCTGGMASSASPSLSSVYPVELLVADVEDHYREFHQLEKYLHAPRRLEDQFLVQINKDDQRVLIESYYEMNSAVVREFLGKKLSSRNRKDLDEVTEKTQVDLKSCRRQFDNIKRVYKAVEESQGNAVSIIAHRFLLPTALCRDYAAIAFMTHHRMETAKKRLAFLSLKDFLSCALNMLDSWTCRNTACPYEECCLDLDREFLVFLRDCKILTERDFIERIRDHGVALVRSSLGKHALIDLETNFKNYLRVLVNMAYNLNHSKEFKDFFLDCVEKIVEPMKNAHWSLVDVMSFLKALAKAPKQSAFLTEHKHHENWIRFMATVSACVAHLFSAYTDSDGR